MRLLAALAFLFLSATPPSALCERSFEIGYEGNTFLKDGKPFRYISGSVHYMRVPRGLWLDRLLKVREAGFNAIQFIVQWNLHEPLPGQFDFSGRLDVEAFVEMAHSLGLLVILRPGPYICGERDGGGLPFWLYELYPGIKLRSSDPDFLRRVDTWWDELLPRIRPLLYTNGGPVVMAQLENEYGSYAAATGHCDRDYMRHLGQQLRRHLGEEVLLYTTDGDSKGLLKCGKTEGAYATVDFGPGVDPKRAFELQRTVEPRGPLVNSEYYPGWLDYWGDPHHTVSVNTSAAGLDAILSLGASVNVYMAHGGTNFGFEAGANVDDREGFKAEPTSYDYDAPISEAGLRTEKFYAFKKIIRKYLGTTEETSSGVRDESGPANYGRVRMRYASSFLDAKGTPVLRRRGRAEGEKPPSFGDLWQNSGFVLYETRIPRRFRQPQELEVDGLRDRGYVFLDGRPQTVLGRGEGCTKAPVLTREGQLLQILVENQGRIGFGPHPAERKGIVSPVKLGKTNLRGWDAYSMPLEDAKALSRFVHGRVANATVRSGGWSAFWLGNFSLPCGEAEASDTFLRLDGWGKGVAFVNGFNLGRYWPSVGPQVTLYVPRTVLLPRCRPNEIIIFEEGKPECMDDEDEGCQVELVDKPVIDGPTPNGEGSEEMLVVRGRRGKFEESNSNVLMYDEVALTGK